VLVNNAGIYARRLIEDTSTSELDRMLAVNVKGVFLGIKAVLPAMRAAGGGSIINLSSVAGIIGSGYSSDYNASKGAVRILTKCAAVQNAKDNIRCNSVHPAPIETDMGFEAVPAGEIRERRLQAGQSPQQRGFAGAVRPDQADHLARRQRQLQPGRQDERRPPPPPVADAQGVGAQHAHETKARARLRRRSNT